MNVTFIGVGMSERTDRWDEKEMSKLRQTRDSYIKELGDLDRDRRTSDVEQQSSVQVSFLFLLFSLPSFFFFFLFLFTCTHTRVTVLDPQIQGLTNKLDFSRADLKTTIEKIAKTDKDIASIEKDLAKKTPDSDK